MLAALSCLFAVSKAATTYISELQNAKMCSDWQASLSPKMKNAGIVAYIPPLLLVTVTLFSTDHPVFPDSLHASTAHHQNLVGP